MNRTENLRDLAAQCIDIYDDRAADVLAGRTECPRYALLTSEGSPESSYRDNPNLSVHDTPEAMGERAAGELGEGWGILGLIDLDTGDDLGYTIKVEVQA